MAAPSVPLRMLEAVSEMGTRFVTFLGQDLEVYMMWFERQL